MSLLLETAAAATVPTSAMAAAAALSGQGRRCAQQQKGGQDRDEGFHRTDSATFDVTMRRRPAEGFRMLSSGEQSAQDMVKYRLFGVRGSQRS